MGFRNHGEEVDEALKGYDPDKVVRLSGATWRRLQARAEGFRADPLGTPDKVIASLLDALDARPVVCLSGGDFIEYRGLPGAVEVRQYHRDYRGDGPALEDERDARMVYAVLLPEHKVEL